VKQRTITALATAPGIAGLAVIRISGSEAIDVADKIFRSKKNLASVESHTIHYGKIFSANTHIDSVTASVFKSPNSYTGEDVVEFGCHGGYFVVNMILEALYSAGAFPAEAGEFTKRAFLNGKLDLSQAEAVADLIHSASAPGTITAARQLDGKFTEKLSFLRSSLIDIAGLLELELDFTEEDLEFIDRKDLLFKVNEVINFCQSLADTYVGSEILRSGFQIGIVGKPNSGKSTLFNALIGKDRAIVSDIAGTTRDYIEESVYVDGITLRFADTAGLRETDNLIEIEGIKLVDNVLRRSNLILVLADISDEYMSSIELAKALNSQYKEAIVLIAANKIDKQDKFKRSLFDFSISAKSGVGISLLKEKIADIAKSNTERVSDALINSRHFALLKSTIYHLINALNSIDSNMSNEVVAIDIRNAGKCIAEITGEEWNDEILNQVFARFCIGK